MAATMDVGRANKSEHIGTKRIGLAGDSSTGKTTYLAVLTNLEGKPPLSSGSSNPSATIYCTLTDQDNQETRTLLQEHSKRIRDNKFPVATRIRLNSEGSHIINKYRVSVCDVHSNTERAVLECYDWPGEIINIVPKTEVVTRANFSSERDAAFEQLAEYDGLLYLLDPYKGKYAGNSALAVKGPDSIGGFFQELLLKLPDSKKSNKQIAIPIALCLSRMDLPEHWPHFSRPEDYAEMLWPGIGAVMKEKIKSGYYRWFSMSAIGVVEDEWKCLRSNSYQVYDEDEKDWESRIFISNIRPVGIYGPIEWLLNHKGG